MRYFYHSSGINSSGSTLWSLWPRHGFHITCFTSGILSSDIILSLQVVLFQLISSYAFKWYLLSGISCSHLQVVSKLLPCRSNLFAKLSLIPGTQSHFLSKWVLWYLIQVVSLIPDIFSSLIFSSGISQCIKWYHIFSQVISSISSLYMISLKILKREVQTP